MDKIEKIRKKIKELQDEFISIHPKDCSLKLIKSYAGYAYLDKVLSFIDTLEEETDKDLEKAAEKYTDNPDTYAVWTEHYGDFVTVDDIELIEKAFKAGVNWQKEQGKSKEAVVGLSTRKLICEISEDTLNQLDVNHGDKVIIQIRKV